ncbi:ubiquinone biosynthesis accessory factor UbiJ [Aliidiomarina sp. Khilg15.8]
MHSAFNALAETLVNAALKEDPGSQARLRAVQGKTFRVRLDELPWPLTLTFTRDQVLFMGAEYEAIDGEVSTSLSMLQSLQDASEVTQAIQRGEVHLHGDPIFAQHASQVLLGLQIDWEQAMADRFGDVAGYWLSQGIQRAKSRIPSAADWRNWLSETLTEEKKLLPGQVEYALFSDDLRALSQRVNALEQQCKDR